MKAKKCRVCKSEFVPQRVGQKVCCPTCALALAKSERAKVERKHALMARRETRKRLDSMKGLPQLIREAQTAFNAYIRARDAGLPCICCGQFGNGQTRGGEWDAGHYRSRGAAPHLRFDERNVHAQLKHCNRYKAGNVVGYRAGLVARIGIAAVEALEADNSQRKWTRDELIDIKRTYTAKRKALEAAR
jgi:hypothetical protein